MHIESTPLGGLREVPDPPHRVPRWNRILVAIAFTLYMPVGATILAYQVYKRIFSGIVDDARRDEWYINQEINKSLDNPSATFVRMLILLAFIYSILIELTGTQKQ